MQNNSELQSLVRDQHGLRLEPEMTQYFITKSAESDQLIPVIGSDARTGVPRREMLSAKLLREKQP